MKYIFNYKILTLVILFTILESCTKIDTFLSQMPNKSTAKPLQNIDELDGILGLYSSFWVESSGTTYAGSDDFGVLKEIHDSYSGIYGGTSMNYMLLPAIWDIPAVENSGDKGWAEAWGKIFKANMVLGNLIAVIAKILSIALNIYMWIIIIRALLSWVNPDPYNPIVMFLYRITEPVLSFVRRKLPIGSFGIDFSPMIVILIIWLLQEFLVSTLLEISFRFQ